MRRKCVCDWEVTALNTESNWERRAETTRPEVPDTERKSKRTHEYTLARIQPQASVIFQPRWHGDQGGPPQVTQSVGHVSQLLRLVVGTLIGQPREVVTARTPRDNLEVGKSS
jgi:hypothetical protein